MKKVISKRLVFATLLGLATAFGSVFANPEMAINSLTVDESRGAVKVHTSNRWRSPFVGMNLLLPTSISTGADGIIKVRQDKTTIAVAENSAIEILASAAPGAPIQRVIQERGSAFYDIAPRGADKLKVETTYLVAVVKGTQFDVTNDSESTTIALFEGHLEIAAPGTGDVVDIFAGQIATRNRDDLRITVIDMENGTPVARNSIVPAGQAGSNGSVIAGTGISLPDSNFAVTGLADSANLQIAGGVNLAGAQANIAVSSKIDIGGTALNLDQITGDVDVNANLDLGGGTVALDVGSDIVDVGADLDLGDGTIGLDAGGGIVDVSASLDLDLGEVIETLNLDELDALIEEDTADTVTPEDDVLPDLGDLLGL